MKRRTSVALVLAAIATTVAVVVLSATSDVLATPLASAIVRGATCAAWTLCGLRTWERRPDSPLGAVMVVGGFAYALGALNSIDAGIPFTLGSLAWLCGGFLVAYVALVFPDGRLPDRLSRTVALLMGMGSAVLWGVLLLGASTMPTPAKPFRCTADCPTNPFDVLGLSADAATVVERGAYGIFGLFSLVAIAILVRRLRAASPVGRRVLMPPTLCLCVIAGSFLIAFVLMRAVGGGGLAGASGWVPPIASIAFPVVLLLGQARGRLFAAGSLRDMVSRLSAGPTPPNLETVMAEALGDPSLRLAFPVGRGSFVDSAGAPLAMADGSPPAATEVWDEHQLMAVILHDPALDEPTPGVVEAAGGAIMLALENARLEADVRASARALQESRARMLTAGVSERRRLERDLHDTAQQRLVALRIKFSLARERAGGESAELATLLDELGADVEATIDSVRVVGRGLYPPLLADQGLAAALTSAMSKTPVQLSLSVGSLGRSDPDLEAAVYLCCRSIGELLAEHVAAGTRLTIDCEDDELRIAVACANAVGRPDLTFQVLTNMRDHVGTLGGQVLYANGSEGWRINAAIPWPARASAGAAR